MRADFRRFSLTPLCIDKITLDILQMPLLICVDANAPTLMLMSPFRATDFRRCRRASHVYDARGLPRAPRHACSRHHAYDFR